jgi:hypothetical protein
MLKNFSLKIFIRFLLISFFCSTQLSLAKGDDVNPKTTIAETPKDPAGDKNKETKSSKITKTAKKAFYYTLGSLAATSSAASLVGLSLFIKNLKDIKNSYIKNFTFSLTKKAIWFFSSKPKMNKYIIPGIIFGLAANAILSSVMSVWMFLAGYKA